MRAGDWQAIVNHHFSPGPVEVKSDDIFPVDRCDWFSELFVERIQLVREHLIM